jgi:hypothetical protein
VARVVVALNVEPAAHKAHWRSVVIVQLADMSCPIGHVWERKRGRVCVDVYMCASVCVTVTVRVPSSKQCMWWPGWCPS